jgi:hypothetical protein
VISIGRFARRALIGYALAQLWVFAGAAAAATGSNTELSASGWITQGDSEMLFVTADAEQANVAAMLECTDGLLDLEVTVEKSLYDPNSFSGGAWLNIGMGSHGLSYAAVVDEGTRLVHFTLHRLDTFAALDELESSTSRSLVFDVVANGVLVYRITAGADGLGEGLKRLRSACPQSSSVAIEEGDAQPGVTPAAEGWSLVEQDTVMFASVTPEADLIPALGTFEIGCATDRPLNIFYNVQKDALSSAVDRPTARLVMRVDPNGSDVFIVSETTRLDGDDHWTFGMDRRHLADFAGLLANASQIVVGVVPGSMTSAEARDAFFEHGLAFTVDTPTMKKVMAKCPAPAGVTPVDRRPDQIADDLHAPDGQWIFSTEFRIPTALVNFRGRRVMLSCDGNYSSFTISLPSSQLRNEWVNAGISVGADFMSGETISYLPDIERYDIGERAVFSVTTTQAWFDDAQKARAKLIVGVVFNPEDSVWTNFPVRGSTAAIRQLRRACG